MAFGGILGGLMSLMPGYIQGRQQAINDNWKDIQNYDTSFGHELDNSYKEQVMPDIIGNQHMQFNLNKEQYDNYWRNVNNYRSAFDINSAWQPYLAGAAGAGRIAQSLYYMRMLGSGPLAQASRGQTPSTLNPGAGVPNYNAAVPNLPPLYLPPQQQ